MPLPRSAANREPVAVFGVFSLPSCIGYPQTIACYRRKTGLALPGGFVHAGETAETALARKVSIETGVGEHCKVGRQLYEGDVDGQLVRTYEIDLTKGAQLVTEWTSPDELITAQASKSIALYNLSVLLAAGLPLSVLGEAAWISALGSGTLQRSVDSGAAWRELYLHERCAMELGPEWDTAATSRIQRGRPLAMGDTPQWTEAMWTARRFRFAGPPALQLQNINPEWVTISDPDAGPHDSTWEGLALITQPRDLEWWPAGRVAIARLARWNAATGRFV